MNIKLKKEFGSLKSYSFDLSGSYIGRLKSTTGKDKRLLSDNELPSPTNDKIFKIAFGNVGSKRYACKLFNTVLDFSFEEVLSDMHLEKNELDVKKLDELSRRVDVNYICGGVHLSLEMNNSNVLERNCEYAHRLYARLMSSDVDKRDRRYEDVIQFNINNFLIEGIEKTIDISVCSDGVNRRTRIIYVDIYLPRILKKYEEEGQMSLSDSERTILAMFIGREREASKLGKEDETVRRFIRMLKRLKRDREVMEEYGCVNSEVYASREEGKEIGREENKEETAIAMLKDGMSPKTVQKYTKLSDRRIKDIMMML